MRHRRHAAPHRQRTALRHLDAADTSPVRPGDEPMGVHHVPTGVDLIALDHVGLGVADPEAVAAFLCEHVGMDRLARDADVTVVGAGAGAATLRLAAAGEPRDGGPLARVVLRVADIERAVAMLPAGTAVEGDQIEEATFEGPHGLGLGFTMVAGGGIDYDIDHVDLCCSDLEQMWASLVESGFVPRGDALYVADKCVALAAEPPQRPQRPQRTRRPLLDHLGVRVESIAAVVASMRERGIAVDERTAHDACVIALPGPEQIGLHFVSPAQRSG